MEYREATDRLIACGVTLADIADAAGMQHQTIRLTRLDPDNPSYRSPPDDWRRILRAVAKRHSALHTDCAADLLGLARDLEKDE